MTYISNADRSHTSPRQTQKLSIRQWVALWRSRRALAHLDAAQLRDAGITPDEAARESARAPWDVPQTWRK